MITKLGAALMKLSGEIDGAMSFVTDAIRNPRHPDQLYVPPVEKKKVDERGEIIRPLTGYRPKPKFFGKYGAEARLLSSLKPAAAAAGVLGAASLGLVGWRKYRRARRQEDLRGRLGLEMPPAASE